MRFKELQYYYDNFINGNYEKESVYNVYQQLIAAYEYIIKAKEKGIPTISIEEFNEEINKRVLVDNELSLLKNYLMILDEKDFIKRLDIINKNNLEFKSSEIVIFGSKSINKLLPNIKYLSKKELWNLIKFSKNQELCELAMKIKNNDQDSELIEPIKKYLLDHKKADTVIIDAIFENMNISIYKKLGDLVSKLNPEKLLDFLVDNRIVISSSLIPEIYISNNKIKNVLQITSSTIDEETIIRSKNVLLLFSDKKEERKQAYDYFSKYAYVNDMKIGKFTGGYINIKLNKNLFYLDMEKLIKNQLELVKKEFEVKEEINEEIKKENAKINESMMNFSKNLLLDYLNDYSEEKISLDDFAANRDMSVNECKNIFKIVKEFDPKLYDKYIALSEMNSKKSFAIIMNMANAVAEGLKNGIENDDGTKRPFDIIDYCNICNFNFDTIKKIMDSSSKFTKETKSAFAKFVAKYKTMKFVKKSTIEEMTFYAGGKIENGNVVGARILTNEEKEEIFKYLKDNNTPLSMLTFNLAKERVLKRLNKKESKKK